MTCRIAELQYKEVIDITNGIRYGFVSDVELDLERGAIESVIIRGRPRLWGLLGREPDAVFPWHAVRRVGEDIILVDGASLGEGMPEQADFFSGNW